MRFLNHLTCFMSDEILNFEEHRRRRDGNPSVVPCARCGKTIVATATRCPECGVHFAGEAQFFVPTGVESNDNSGIPWRTMTIILLLLTALVLSALLMR
jgi:hypothetical protein